MRNRLIIALLGLATLFGVVGCASPPSYPFATIVLGVGFPTPLPHRITWVVADGQVERTEERDGTTTTDSYPLADPDAYATALHEALNAPTVGDCADANLITIQARDENGKDHAQDWLLQCGKAERYADALVDAVERSS